MAHDPGAFGTFEAVEIARELATLVMIGTVGLLAGRPRTPGLGRRRFGTWDIVAYAGLRLAIGWPPSMETWDVLFLVPTPWVGPVWAPLIVSLALVAVGLAAARRVRAGLRIAVGTWRAVGRWRGWPRDLELPARAEPGAHRSMDRLAGVWLGMALAIVATASALAGPGRSSLQRFPFQHGFARRPPVGTPD